MFLCFISEVIPPIRLPWHIFVSIPAPIGYTSLCSARKFQQPLAHEQGPWYSDLQVGLLCERGLTACQSALVCMEYGV